MKFCTAVDAELAGGTGAALDPPHDNSKKATGNHRC
jgi:hypothetical protein